MNLFKKLFSHKKEESNTDYLETASAVENLSLDEIFVHNFIKKGGKFLYCPLQEDVNQNLLNIIEENSWENIVCFNNDLNKILTVIDKNSITTISKSNPFFTTCEHLVSENGSVLFSSNQVHQHKIPDLPTHFIVFAKTSQLVRTTGESLMSIRKNYKKDFPSNISSIKSYMPNKVNDDFLSYGNTNAKSLYLLLLEDL